MRNLIRAALKRRKALKFYRELFPAGSLCFDVGASRGEKTELFLSCGARVVAVEPQSICHTLLEKKFSGRKDVMIVRTAVGEKEEEALMHLCNLDEVSTLSADFKQFYSRYDYLDFSLTELVTVTTLDKLIAEHGSPVFCKIDIEGYEENALRGLSTAIPIVEFEFNAPFKNVALACIQRLSELGDYRFNYCTYENYRFELPQFVSAEEFTKHFSILPADILTGDIFSRLTE